MKITSFISESIISAVGWTLLHAVWQGFILVLVAAIVLYALRKRPSYGRYWVGISTMTLQLITSVVTFAVYYQPYTASAVAPKIVPSAHYLASQLAYAQVALPWYKQVLLFLQIHLDSIVMFWGIGASVLLIRLVGSWVYVQQLRAEGIRLTEPRVQSLFRRIADTLQVRQTVHLFESVRVNTPMVIGFVKPVILLPVGLVTGLTTKQVEAVLAHELAHIKRYDYLVNLLQSLVEVVYFFHPALWWLSVRVREEREHCCDDIAIQVCGDKIALVKALAEVASFRTTPVLAMAFASKKGVLLNRVQRILGVSARPSTSNGNLAGVLLVILLTLGVSVYAFQQDEKPKTNKAKNAGKVLKTTGDGTRIEMDENLKLSKIIWKKRALSKSEIANIQKLREQVNEGTLNLDNVKSQEQRDILLRIIEMENGLHDGLKGLEALSAIDFEAMVPNEAELEAITEAALEEAQPVVDAVLAAFPDSINMARMSAHSRKIDSLSRLMEPQHQKMEALHREMEQYEFKTSELERKMEVLEWKRSKLYDGRGQLLEKRNRTMYQEGQKVKKSEAEVEKELAQFEEQIKQQETQIQQLNQQTAELRQQIKSARQPLEELENQIRKLEEMNEKYSHEMERYSSEMAHMFPPPPPPAAPRAIRAPRAVASPRSPRPALAPVAPISPISSKTPPPPPPKKK
jgi:bla regulator protein blaR1